MTELYLIRHGHAQGGPSGMDRDFFLTELGQRQAHALGKQLKASQLKPRRIYSSKLTRARQTASILREYLDAPIVERHDLIEHGTHAYLEDCSVEEAIRRYPEQLDREGKCIYKQGPQPGLSWDFSCGGEDLRALHARARGAFDSLLEEHRDEPGTFLVVAHGSFLSAFLTEVLGMPLRPVWNFNFDNCGCMRLKIHTERAQVWAVLAVEGPVGEHTCH